ncbi:MAG TPA: HU family DNA-binding protein [Desulfomonilaceae bacterium]|nr:HU family DNA-binding protein [Desulfomonilaceae bacterium]
MTLKKEDIAHKIASDCGFTKTEAAKVIEKLLRIIKERLIAGEDVMISGFGKWHVRSKLPRPVMNLRTGKQIVLDARRVVRWRYSQVLKAAVNGTKHVWK